jgi:hypothetical protein
MSARLIADRLINDTHQLRVVVRLLHDRFEIDRILLPDTRMENA